ncbi:MAG: RagB/SusD family nutrient uptake outer membrane protein [Bacteroidaceae bacterium]|nr:RagB/SusD family nutrient uptake outer membrane protein [Bacteroidaceae bacterium]
MKNFIKNITLLGCVATGLGLTACEDFLTITPTSSIVEEDYWKDKNDLENAVYGCYRRLATQDIIQNYIYWGEMRADNFDRSSAYSATGQVPNIMNANLLPTYNIFDWTNMYNAINYCNKVLSHGPAIVNLDESFTQGDWKPIRAEMIALRALNHFYLVRSFGEIPYVTKDYNNDSEELRQTQLPQLAVLDSIINDLESVKDEAMVEFANTVQNKGRITQKAIYALLADVYLWRASYKAGNCHPFTSRNIPSYNVLYTDGKVVLPEDNATYGTTAEEDYKQCISYCDKIIETATKEKIKKLLKSGEIISESEADVKLEDLLIQNESSILYVVNGTVSSEGAYTAIFGEGNSDESIFELQFDGITYFNSAISNLYWNTTNNKDGLMEGATALMESVETNPNVEIPSSMFTKTDYRRWESFIYTESGQTKFSIGKYVNRLYTQSVGSNSLMTDNTATNYSFSRVQESQKANWIVYRLSEIFLMKAEAMTQIYADEENLQQAFNYVREVFKRSNPYAYSKTNSTSAATDSLSFKNFSNSASLEKLIMAERQREFVGEGKRWFDLVRYAQRRGNTEDMLELLTRKYTSNSKSIKAKLADIQSLFNPVYEEELKRNTWLYQNGIWATDKSSGRTDNL